MKVPVLKLTSIQVMCRKEICYADMKEDKRQLIRVEVELLEDLCHPNIVLYIDYEDLEATRTVHIYMEYCAKGGLSGFIRRLRKSKGEVCREELVWSIFSQIVRALNYCHFEQGLMAAECNVVGRGEGTGRRNAQQPMILHRDLQPENSMYLVSLNPQYACLLLQSFSATTIA
jgi:NIMA (never in mitosis gene a)-related kinase